MQQQLHGMIGGLALVILTTTQQTPGRFHASRHHICPGLMKNEQKKKNYKHLMEVTLDCRSEQKLY